MYPPLPSPLVLAAGHILRLALGGGNFRRPLCIAVFIWREGEMPAQNARSAMFLGGAILAALGAASLESTPANAQETPWPVASPAYLTSGVNFVDEQSPAALQPQRIGFAITGEGEANFAALNQFQAEETNDGLKPRGVELELAAPHQFTGMPLDFSIAQRAAFSAGDDGDINQHSRGAEVRVGALGDPRGGMSERDRRFYMFAASDDEALIWNPGQENRGFALQDRVEIGDIQAGVTYQRGRMQTSVAYIQREISANAGRTSFSDTEDFAAFTFTMRN